jgi:hypothetical protein
MATQPNYAGTVNNGAALLGAAETSLTAPTTTSTVFTAGASGSKVEQISVTAIATTVAGVVYVFLHDGTNYRLFDVLAISANTASTSLVPYTVTKTYDNLLIKTGWTVRMSQSIAGNANLLVAHAAGGDF